MQETFIGQYYLDDLSICDSIIEYFKNSPNKKVGKVGFGDVDKTIKESTDLYLDNGDLANSYGLAFQRVLDKYMEQYKFCNKYQPFGLIEKVNIQHYLPKQGFHQWHTERTGKQDLVGSRHLVFMTYLNDVNDGGETEFYYQELKVKPRKGLTIIWPADWTHTHRGITSNTEEKYILTGWLNFIN
jgi:prolyl 4-hydroxylase